MDIIIHRKLCTVAKFLGIAPFTFKHNKNRRLLYSLYIVGLFCIYNFLDVIFLKDRFKGKLIFIVACWIQVVIEKLLMISMLFMSIPNNHLWIQFFNKMQKISPKKYKRVENIFEKVMALLPFLLLGIFLSNDVVQTVLHYLDGRDCFSYIMFFISNNYVIFTCIFLSKTMNILHNCQKNLIEYLQGKRKTIVFVFQEEVTHTIRKVNIIFKSHCKIIKYMNKLFGWRMVFIFTGCILNVSNFATFFFMHFKFQYGKLLTLTDSIRTIIYLVS